MRGFFARLLVALITLCLAAPVAADEPPPGSSSRRRPPSDPKVDQMVITARKREETLQSAPLSISAFDEDALEESTLRNLTDIGEATPNLLFEQSTNPYNPRIYIRGVGSDDRIATVDPAIGVYVNGVYQARTYGLNLDLDDVERVEVLRGPQGTLYGRNTIGGAINIITKQPTGELESRVTAEVGTDRLLNLSGASSFPLVENVLAGHVALASKYYGGYFDNDFDGSHWANQRALSGRAILNWAMSEELEATLAFDRSINRAHPGGGNINSTCEVAGSVFCSVLTSNAVQTSLRPLSEGQDFETRLNAGTNSRFNQNRADRSDNIIDAWGPSLTMMYDGGSVLFKSITAWRRVEMREALDVDGTPISYAEFFDHDQNDQITQELQLNASLLENKLILVSGLYYFYEDNKNEQTGLVASDVIFPVGIVQTLSNALSSDSRSDQTVNSYSAYTNASFDLGSGFTLEGGLRYTYDHKDFKRFETRRSGANPTNFNQTQSFDDWSPTFGLQWQANDDLQLYGRWSRGFRSGGFNGRVNQTNPQTAQPFEPETVKGVEVGMKSTWLDDELVLNLAVFRNILTDAQITTFTFDGTQFVSLVNNAGRARLQGLEAEIVYQPISGLELGLGIGMIDDEYFTYREPVLAPTPGINDASSRRFKNTPRRSFNPSIGYTFAAAGGFINLRADYSHRSKVYFNAATTASIQQAPVGLLNGRIGWTSQDDRLEFALWGRNLTNRHYDAFGLDVTTSLGFTTTFPGAPRELGIVGTVRF
jgi:iron complex outermembrane recepter protein